MAAVSISMDRTLSMLIDRKLTSRLIIITSTTMTTIATACETYGLSAIARDTVSELASMVREGRGRVILTGNERSVYCAILALGTEFKVHSLGNKETHLRYISVTTRMKSRGRVKMEIGNPISLFIGAYNEGIVFVNQMDTFHDLLGSAIAAGNGATVIYYAGSEPLESIYNGWIEMHMKDTLYLHRGADVTEHILWSIHKMPESTIKSILEYTGETDHHNTKCLEDQLPVVIEDILSDNSNAGIVICCHPADVGDIFPVCLSAGISYPDGTVLRECRRTATHVVFYGCFTPTQYQQMAGPELSVHLLSPVYSRLV